MKLRSENGRDRAGAFESIRSDTANLREPNVRKALLDLLDRENNELDRALAEAQKKNYPDTNDEGNAMYYSDLLDMVDSFADWNEPRQACILVSAASSYGTAFADEIAAHPKTSIPCLLKRSKSEISMNRAVAVPILVEAVSKSDSNLDPSTVQASKQVILSALHDKDEAVRSFTVEALGDYGSADMIAPLREVAARDPGREIQGQSVRKSAAKAIEAIKKRTTK
jgi:hypothetical protein